MWNFLKAPLGREGLVYSSSALLPHPVFVSLIFAEVLSDEDKPKTSKIKKKMRQKVHAVEQGNRFWLGRRAVSLGVLPQLSGWGWERS